MSDVASEPQSGLFNKALAAILADPPWAAKSFHSQVQVNRLSNRESLRMASSLLGTEEIASDLQELMAPRRGWLWTWLK